jgi:aryl-alcohol dehydrogenase-like predicted oxidoreductase
MADDDPNAAGNSRRHIVEQCEASLARLQTDYIDLYQIHRPQPEIPIDETLRALDDLIRAGKVRYIGTSTFAAWQVVEALYVARELGLNRFVSEQPPYNLLDRRIERELVPMAQGYGLALIPWSPLASGFLSGKYRRGGELPADSRFTARNEWNDKHLSDAAFALVDKLAALAKRKGCTTSQLALAWCSRQPGVTSPIIGPRTMEQLRDNLGSLAVVFTEEDGRTIDVFAPPGRATVVYDDADFRASPYRQI